VRLLLNKHSEIKKIIKKYEALTSSTASIVQFGNKRS
jgi:hypothetical protein